MRFDENLVRDNVRTASTEDLLDRVTFYRAGMEPLAIAIIEAELRERGIGPEKIADWGPRPGEDYLRLEDGTVARCSFCRRPARRHVWGWHRLWRVLPIFPRRFLCCEKHGGAEPVE